MVPNKKASDPNEFGGTWSIKKLECVESYLRSYLTVMKRQDWSVLWYIDAFSGDGYQRFKRSGGKSPLFAPVGDAQVTRFVEGSSLRALRVSSDSLADGGKGFDRFVFIELNPKKLDGLRASISDRFPDQIGKCLFERGDVNDVLPRILASINWRTGRAVSFIDPFATQLRWHALSSFKGTCSDVWLLFPLGGVIRMLPHARIPKEKLGQTLDDIFGDKGWRDLYRTPTVVQPDLFGEISDSPQRKTGSQELLDYYTSRLESIFPGVLDPIELRTGRNAPLFALYSLVANSSDNAIRRSQAIAGHVLKGIRG